MNKLVFAILSITAVAAVAADDAAQTAKKEPSPLQRVGGFVFDRRNIQGKFVFADATKGKVAPALIATQVSRAKESFSWEVVSTTVDPVKFTEASAALKRLSATAGVVLVDDPAIPAMIVFPEEKCAVVNVAALSAGNPAKGVLDARLSKEIGRAVVFALGGGYTSLNVGAMQPIASLAELDKIDSDHRSRFLDGRAPRGSGVRLPADPPHDLSQGL